MKYKCVIWIGMSALAGQAFADPASLRANADPLLRPVKVSTNRSDGAIYPAISQIERRQKPRQVRMTSSIQALPKRGTISASGEASAGGVFVVGAGGHLSGNEVPTATISTHPIIPVSLPRQSPPQRPH